MPRPLLLITGFGPFEGVLENPSGRLVTDLLERPPGDFDVVGEVLPVSFGRAPARLGELLAELAPRVPDLAVSTGMHRQPGFRVELLARRRLVNAERVDVDGVVAAAADPEGVSAQGVLETSLAARLPELLEDLPGWRLSRDAGGYVCERVYRTLLEWGAAAERPALFVHVPQYEFRGPEAQREETLRFLRPLLG